MPFALVLPRDVEGQLHVVEIRGLKQGGEFLHGLGIELFVAHKAVVVAGEGVVAGFAFLLEDLNTGRVWSVDGAWPGFGKGAVRAFDPRGVVEVSSLLACPEFDVALTLIGKGA